ncbi:MAG: hypothetical protein WC603_02950 [Candidatus Paceibacterota bacterium]|jgi:hypothetical protein
MKFEENVKLLTALSNPYDMSATGGPVGVSHKVRLNINGEIFVANATEDQVKEYSKFEGKDGVAVLNFTSPKEKLRLSLVSFSV